ncbi:AAA family ATPase [Anatilimnocola floriformis]|uniref:AAA family ATPase n=1 Tax=Anatilimnocola floriformis TaxID=2948575 RepID=UPI0020C2525D|nr:AAA family ATPase [Anatilimnocola floriformis]
MSLTERLSELVRACFTGLWIESHEHDDAHAEIAELCRREEWRLATWNIEEGLKIRGHEATVDSGATDPLAAVRALGSFPTSDNPAILVLTNFHRFLHSTEVVQALAKQLTQGKQNRTFIVVLSPVVQVPAELDKQFVVVEHTLPVREQLAEIARSIATEREELPNGIEFERVLDASAGLTRYEAEGAFSLSLVRHGRLRADVLWEVKTQMLKKSGLLSLHRGGETFADLGGLEAVKAFCQRSLRLQANRKSEVRPRGILLLSPPGCGKSQFCKALGNETGRPTLVLDIASLLGSLVGQSEANIRQALRIIDAMAPAVLFLDECEKAFSGVSGQGDSGVSTRLFGSFLSWLNDHESDVFVVATANDISKLPPEFSRAERFDGVFFLDLPDAKQRQAIWQVYIAKYELDAGQELPTHEGWTGAEIKACCRLAGKPKIFRDSAVENLRDFFERFRHLNIRSCAQLDELVAQAQRVVRGVEPQQLRDNQNLRQQVAVQLSSVQSVLDGMLVDRPRRNILRRGK